MFTRSILALTSLALPLLAQEEGANVKPASAETATATFYKAYFLDNDQGRSKEATKQAIDLYQGFLASNPDHELSGKAASRCLILLYSTADIKAARAFLKQHEALITKAEKAETDARRAEGDTELQGKLREAAQAAREDGDQDEARRIAAAMFRAGGMRFGPGGQGPGGMGGRGFGDRGGAGRGNQQQLPKIADMSKEDATKAVEQLVTRMERTIDFLANQGQADRADALEAKLDKIQDLVDDGKMGEAQKIIDGLQEEMQNMRGAGRGGRGGEGRRRPGGEDGGERRPPGEDGGERRPPGEEGGERRPPAGEGDK